MGGFESATQPVSLEVLVSQKEELIKAERLKEALKLDEYITTRKEADENGESATSQLPPPTGANLPPPPPGHMTMASMRGNIQSKCGLDKAASFMSHFGTPLGDIAVQDLIKARAVQRDAIRWVRTLSLFTGNELERYGGAWRLAMQKMRKKMSQAVRSATALTDAVVSESEMVLKQAAASPKLTNFVKGTVELYRAALKIESACEAHPFCAQGNSMEETRKSAAEVRALWSSFRTVVGTIGVEVEEVEVDTVTCWLTSDDQTTADWTSVCALTLLPIELGTTESTVTWKGRRYLTSCANFWLHCVSETPPHEQASWPN